jgi:hypothetical protein
VKKIVYQAKSKRDRTKETKKIKEIIRNGKTKKETKKISDAAMTDFAVLRYYHSFGRQKP